MMSIAGNQQAAPNLTLSAPDEDMELGSDAGRNEDNDIELDYPLNQDDDFMMDARSEDGQDAQNMDHQMDGDHIDGGITLATEDEHLADASDIGLQNTIFAQTAMPLSENDLIDYDDGDDDVPEEDVLLDLEEPTSLEPKLSDIQQVPTPQADSPTRYPSLKSHSISRQGSQHGQTTYDVLGEQDGSEIRSTHDLAAVESTHPEAQAAFEDEKQTEYPPTSTLDQNNLTNYSVDEGTDVHAPLLQEAIDLETANAQHTRSSLHPVTVNWNSEEYHMFRLQEDDDPDVYFTADESLAQTPISSLFAACRNTLCDEINEDEELEMDMQDIGLFINEDSIHCSNHTFNNILEIYILLQEQDGVSNPGPLYVTLTTNPRFSSRLETLREAASEGKGLSSLTFLQALDHGTRNEEEYYEDAEYSPNDNEDGDHSAQYHEGSHDQVQPVDHHSEADLKEPYPVAHHEDNQGEQYDEFGSVEHAGTDNNYETYGELRDDNHQLVDPIETTQAVEDQRENFADPEDTVYNHQSKDGEDASSNNLGLSEEASAQHHSIDEVENNEDIIYYTESEDEVEPDEQKLSGNQSTGSSTVQGDEKDSSHLATGDNSVAPEGFAEDKHAHFDPDNNVEGFDTHDSTLLADDFDGSASADFSGINNQGQYENPEYSSPAQQQLQAAGWEQQNTQYGEESLGQDYGHDDTVGYDLEEHAYEEPDHGDVSYDNTSLYDQDNVDTLGNEEGGLGDHGDEEHGNFNYPEFNDQPTEEVAENNETGEEQGELEHGFDVIDYGNEDEEEEDAPQHTVNEPPVGPTHSSPPPKRSFDELVADEANSSSNPQDTKRVRPS